MLLLTEETFEVLLKKPPKASEASGDILREEEVQNVHSLIYDGIQKRLGMLLKRDVFCWFFRFKS